MASARGPVMEAVVTAFGSPLGMNDYNHISSYFFMI